MPEKSRAQRNNRANQLNPNNKLHTDNRSNQSNLNNDAYWQARGFDKRPKGWRQRAKS